MGDRANVAVKVGYGKKINEPGACVVFYTHWSGSEVPGAVAAALTAGKDRWDDPPYLARVVFDRVKGDDKGTTGYGIDTDLGDNEYPLLVVDPDTKTVLMFHHSVAEGGRVLNCPGAEASTAPLKSWTFDEFVKLGEKERFGWDDISSK